jgi:hypothetical protein
VAAIYEHMAVSQYSIHHSHVSTLNSHHIYMTTILCMFDSFPPYTQKISYYSSCSHLLPINITETCVKYKGENYENTKNSNIH